MTDTLVERPPAKAEVRPPRRPPILGWWRDPWRKPRVLATVTWAYLAWSILPVTIAIAISFNAGRSNEVWQGFSFQWWWGHPVFEPSGALFVDPELHAALFQSLRVSFSTMIIAVPLGVAFAIGVDRWRGRVATGASFIMLISFVMPEIIIGITMFLFFTYLLTFVHLGTIAQVLALITFEVSYPVIIIRARLLSIGKEYEEAAMDLGASPTQAVRRVLLPMLYPAILASFAIVFADTIDDFITVRYLSGGSNTEPLSVKIYNFSRGSLTPAINAAATFMLVMALIVVLLVYVVYRRLTKGQREQPSVTELLT